MVLGILISIPIFGIDISNFKEHFNPLSSGNLNFMKFMQVWQSIAIFVLPPLLAAYLFSNDIKSYLKLKIYPDINSVLILLMIVFFSIPLINYFALLNSQIVLPSSMSGLEASIKAAEQSAKELTEAYLKTDSVWGLLFNLFMVALIPAIGEELLFRGVLLRLFKEWTKNIYLAIFITGFLFSFIHFQFYGFVPRFLLGVFYGFLVYKTGSLWFPVIAHFINNAIGVFVYYFYFDRPNFEEIEGFGTSNYFFLIFSVLFFAALTYLLFNKFAKKNHLD